MGEIADALKKANAERVRAREATPAPAPPPVSDPERSVEEVARDWGREVASPHARAQSPADRPAGDAPRSADATTAPSTLRDRLARQAAALPAAPAEAHLQSLPAVVLDGKPPQVDLTRHLALRLKSEMERRGAHSVLIGSPLRNEGKTTVSCNLAIALASVSGGHGVALVDLDLRNPSICKRLDITVKRGIDEVMLDECRLEDACHSLDAPRIDVYPCARPQHAAHELLASDRFPVVLKELCKRYEIVVIDSPPTLLVPDSALILRHADTCVAVAHCGVSRVRMLKKMLSMLPADRILGKVLNAAPAEKHQRAYYAYGYGAESEERPEGARQARKRRRKTA